MTRRAAITIRPIRTAEAVRARHTGHYFDADTMRYFGSRLLDGAYPATGGARSYFVTSEQDRYGAAWNGARRYSVRCISTITGDIDTPHDDAFGKFGTAAAARRVARACAAADTLAPAAMPCAIETHRKYSTGVQFRGREYCGACVDDAARMLAERRLSSDGAVTRTAAIARATGTDGGQ